MKLLIMLLICTYNLHAASPVQLERLKIEYRTLITDPVNNEAAIRTLFAQARKSSAGTAWAAGQEKDFEQKLQEGRRKLGMQPAVRVPAPWPSRVQPSAVEPIRRVALAIEQSQLITPSAAEIFNKLNRLLDAQSSTARWSKAADDELNRLRYAAAQHADLNEFVTVYIDEYLKIPAGKTRNELVRLMQEAERLSMTDLMGNRKRIVDLAASMEKLGAAKTAQLIRANLPSVPQAPPEREEKRKGEAEVKRKEAISDEQRKKATEELKKIIHLGTNTQTPLRIYHFLDKRLDLIKKAIENGAEIDKAYSSTILFSYNFIVRRSYPDFVINPSLLMLAAYSSHTELINFLLSHGADVNLSVPAKDFQGKILSYGTPLYLAVIGSPSLDPNSDLGVIRQLCLAGARVNEPVTLARGTILSMAVSNKALLPKYIKMLLDCGADPLKENDYGENGFDYLDGGNREDKEEIRKLLQDELRKAARTRVEGSQMVGTQDLEGKPLFIPEKPGIRSLILDYLIGEEPKTKTEEEEKKGAASAVPVSQAEQMSDVD